MDRKNNHCTSRIRDEFSNDLKPQLLFSKGKIKLIFWCTCQSYLFCIKNSINSTCQALIHGVSVIFWCLPKCQWMPSLPSLIISSQSSHSALFPPFVWISLSLLCLPSLGAISFFLSFCLSLTSHKAQRMVLWLPLYLTHFYPFFQTCLWTIILHHNLPATPG